MGEVKEFHPGIVGDGYRVAVENVIDSLPRDARNIVVIWEDENGEIGGATSDGRPHSITLLQRGINKLIASYGDT